MMDALFFSLVYLSALWIGWRTRGAFDRMIAEQRDLRANSILRRMR